MYPELSDGKDIFDTIKFEQYVNNLSFTGLNFKVIYL